MSKIRKSFSLSDEIVGQVSRVAASRGVTDSEVVEKYLTSSLSSTVELTSAERYHFKRNFINKSLDSILRLFGIMQMDGTISDKLMTCLYLTHQLSRANKREFRNGIVEISIFEVLNEIKDMDKNLFNSILTKMNYLGKMRKRYTSLYPLSKRISSEATLAGDTNTNIIQYNNSENPKPQNLSDKLSCSDEEYLKKYMRK